VFPGGFVLTIMSADTERLTAAIGRRLRAIAARVRHPAKPHPKLCGLPTGSVEAEGAVNGRLNKVDVSPEQANATQACLPIGPCCC
jgi:hypothetical protein